jgi:hypothetical protein
MGVSHWNQKGVADTREVLDRRRTVCFLFLFTIPWSHPTQDISRRLPRAGISENGLRATASIPDQIPPLPVFGFPPRVQLEDGDASSLDSFANIGHASLRRTTAPAPVHEPARHGPERHHIAARDRPLQEPRTNITGGTFIGGNVNHIQNQGKTGERQNIYCSVLVPHNESARPIHLT